MQSHQSRRDIRCRAAAGEGQIMETHTNHEPGRVRDERAHEVPDVIDALGAAFETAGVCGFSGECRDGLLRRIALAWRADWVGIVPLTGADGGTGVNEPAFQALSSALPPARVPGVLLCKLLATEEPRFLPAADDTGLCAQLGVAAAVVAPLVVAGRMQAALVAGVSIGNLSVDVREARVVARLLGGLLDLDARGERLAIAEADRKRAEMATGLFHWRWDARDDSARLYGAGLHPQVRESPSGGGRALLAEFVGGDQQGRLHAALASGQDFSRVLPARGMGTQWLRWDGAPTAEGDGVAGVALDVSAQQAEAASAVTAQARLEHLIQVGPLAVYVLAHDGERWRPRFVSASATRLFGYEESDLLDPAWWESHVHPEDLGKAMQARNRAVRHGSASVEYRLRDAADVYRHIHDQASLVRGEDGTPQEVVGLWLDVSERSRAQEEVRASEARYRALVDDTPAMICRYRGDFTITLANAGFSEQYGLGADDLIGRDWLDLLPMKERDAQRARIRGLTVEAPLVSYERKTLTEDHRTRHELWVERALFDEAGRLSEVQAVGLDQSALQQAREELMHAAKMATLGAMVTGVAHEINQPLNVISMTAQNMRGRLERGDVDRDYLRRKAERVEQQISRAASIVDHMRMFGRKSGHEPRTFAPDEPVQNAIHLLGEQLRRRGVEVTVESVGEPLRVRGYVDQVEQVLLNLMNNACDSITESIEREEQSAPGAVTISIARASAESASITVADNGGGIPPALLDRIFEPFFTTKDVGRGTGLGLALCFGMMQDMGGSITVHNAEAGAVFTLTLPLVGPALASDPCADGLAGDTEAGT